ncbi:MAG: DUF3641 domain-containing protein, partial [ANME-2 cluster archaeon]
KYVKKKLNDVEKYYVNNTFSINLYNEVNRILIWMEKNANNENFKTEYKDINFFKSVESLITIISPFCVPSKKEIKEMVINVFENEKWLIIVPKTLESSRLYGMGTKWCTTQKNHFESYNKQGFLYYLIESGNFIEYIAKLVNSFNTAATEHLMCRNTISIGWNGFLYDCDFNQMLELKVNTASTPHISEYNEQELNNREIVVNQHCYGCTAGSGSSCGGQLLS